MSTVLRDLPRSDISAESIRAALTSVLSNPQFEASPRRKKLLAYLVEQTLSGQSDRLKAFNIAVAVLGRSDGFDPQQDPIVRLEAQRLRRDLEHYYLTAGKLDAIRIDVPKGGYVPTFTLAGPTAEADAAAPASPVAPSRDWRRPPRRLAVVALVAGLLLMTALLAFGWTLLWPPSSADVAQELGPVVIVTPFQATGGEGSDLLALGLTDELVASLIQVDNLRLFVGPLANGPPLAASLSPAALRVEGTVRRDQDQIRVMVRLLRVATGEVYWSKGIDRETSMASVLDIQKELAQDIAAGLALPNGALAIAGERAVGSYPATLFAYDCVQRAYQYRRRTAIQDRSAVIACLDEAVKLEPRYAQAWALLTFLHLDGWRMGQASRSHWPSEIALARSSAERAVEIAPDYVLSLQALAMVRYHEGAFDEAEQLQRRALALSPRNPETQVQLGWRLIARDRLDEGIALMRKAIDSSYNSPAWYHQPLALGYFWKGDFGRGYEEGVIGQTMCCSLGNIALAVTAASVGRLDEARAAYARAQEQSGLLAHENLRAFLRIFQVEDRLLDRMEATLRRAGVGDVAAVAN